MEFIYDHRGYPYINYQADEGNWSGSTTYLNHKNSHLQHMQPQVYSAYYNNPGTEWFFPEHDRSDRYMSPSDTYSSSRSEVSTPHDTSSAASVTQYSLAYSPAAVDTVNPFVYGTLAKQIYAHQGMPSAEQDIIHMPFSAHDQVYPFSSHSQPVKEFELDFKDEEEAHEDIIHVHSSLVNPPQEVEFQTETTTTPMDENTPHRNKRTWESESDDELELEEDDKVALEDVADSDWTAKPKPKRRRSSRGSASRTPKQKGSRKSVSETSPKKIPQIPDSIIASREMAPPRQRRVSSKSGKKLPPFAKKAVTALDKKDRSFPCTFHHFGCQSVFPNKNEWKRHVACQHLQLGFYRCDLDACNPENSTTLQASRKNQVKKEEDEEERTVVYNDFNRKDLFTQHARRMHGPTRVPSRCSTVPTKRGLLIPTKEDEAAFEHELSDIRRRCWKTRRNAPSRSNCGICNAVFDAIYFKEFVGKNSGGSMSQGPGDRQNAEEKAWEERMEHVGRHYEKNDYKTSEEIDEDLVEWGLETGLMIRLPNGQAWLASADLPGELSHAGSETQEEMRKTRRQPSRTVVRQTFKKEESNVVSEHTVTSDEDAPGDSE